MCSEQNIAVNCIIFQMYSQIPHFILLSAILMRFFSKRKAGVTRYGFFFKNQTKFGKKENKLEVFWNKNQKMVQKITIILFWNWGEHRRSLLHAVSSIFNDFFCSSSSSFRNFLYNITILHISFLVDYSKIVTFTRFVFIHFVCTFYTDILDNKIDLELSSGVAWLNILKLHQAFFMPSFFSSLHQFSKV